MSETLYVDQHYVANSEFEEIRFGNELSDGMIVLIEDSLFRADMERLNSSYDRARANENNRWCEVTRLQITPGAHGPLVQFVAVYPDGTMCVRQFAASYAWIVKKVTP